MGRIGVETLDLLTQEEAAEMMRLSPRTLERNRYLERGCPYEKVGRRVLYNRADVEAHIRANTHTPAAAA